MQSQLFYVLLNEWDSQASISFYFISSHALYDFSMQHFEGIIGDYSILQRLKNITLVHFAEAWSRDSFSFIRTIFLLIVFHKLSETDGKTALVLSGLASGHLTVICWSCSIAWWLSSSKATGPSTGQPITAPQPSAVDNYRSERVRMSLSPVRLPAPGAISFILPLCCFKWKIYPIARWP